jgi:AcrR family transcriptional regulator
MLTARRQAYRESLREEILDAARQLFVKNGYEATSMRGIAAKVGCSPGILYHYFEDKGDIMAHLVRETFHQLRTRMTAIRNDHDAVPARMRRSLRAYIEFGLEHPHHYELLFVKPFDFENNDNIRAAFAEDGDRTFACMRAMAAEAIGSGLVRPEIQDTEELAQALWVAVHGMVSAQISCHGFPFIERSRLIDRLVDVLLAGVLKS